MKKTAVVLLFLSGLYIGVYAQSEDMFEAYRKFKQEKFADYENFRREANRQYADFMRQAWQWYGMEKPVPKPRPAVRPLPEPEPPTKEELSRPAPNPILYDSVLRQKPLPPQPVPATPIREIKGGGVEDLFRFRAYGTNMQVRLGESLRFKLNGVSEQAVADGWEILSSDRYNNLIRDCLSIRIRHNLSDWAYLNMLKELTAAFFGPQTPEAVLTQAFLFNQSGYKVRLGRSKTDRLYLLVASPSTIYGMSYVTVDGDSFYPMDYQEDGLYLFTQAYPNEQTMSLHIGRDQKFDMQNSEPRLLVVPTQSDLEVELSFNANLIDFYKTYPQSHINNDEMTKWTFFAETPISEAVKSQLYPVLQEAIAGKSEKEAANILLGFVQTAFEYMRDDEVWGQDRPFFAEETLFYPFSDCEDRAVLYSTLIRDLLHLDTVLLYYPGHLAMAVCFPEEMEGKKLYLDGRAYVYCEATCSSFAPVGWCPSNLESVNPVVIVY